MVGYSPRVPHDRQKTIPSLCPALSPSRRTSVDLSTLTPWPSGDTSQRQEGESARGRWLRTHSLLALPQFCQGCLLEGRLSCSPSPMAPALSPGWQAHSLLPFAPQPKEGLPLPSPVGPPSAAHTSANFSLDLCEGPAIFSWDPDCFRAGFSGRTRFWSFWSNVGGETRDEKGSGGVRRRREKGASKEPRHTRGFCEEHRCVPASLHRGLSGVSLLALHPLSQQTVVPPRAQVLC